MKKIKGIRIKEFERTILLVDIIMNLLIMFLGYILIYEFNDITYCNYNINESVYYLIAFVSILAYAVNRRKNNYEYLILGFIGIYTAGYICLNESNPNTTAILGTALLIFSTSYMINKIYNAYRLYKEKDINFISKAAIGIVLGAFGIYMSQIAYMTTTIVNYVVGYYLIIFGLLSLLEPLIEFLLRDPLIANKAYMLLKYEKTVPVEKKIRKVKTKRLRKNKKEETEESKEEKTEKKDTKEEKENK